MTGWWWAADPPPAPVWQTWLPALIAAALAAVVTAMGTVAVKRMGRRLDEATTVKTEAETGKARAETVSIEVATARALLSDVKDMLVDQRQQYETQIAMLQGQQEALIQSVRVRHDADMRSMQDRLGGIETAWAAHREWDVAATQILRQVEPDFRDPPPLTFD